MFADLAWVAAQDENIAARFVRLGTRSDRVAVTSSLKWDSAAVGDHVEGAEELSRALGLDGKRPLWVCGSTGPGEETVLLDAYGRLLAKSSGAARDVPDGSAKGGDASVPILAIVPRKPERFEEVARLIQRAGYTCIRRSRHDASRPLSAWPKDAVILGDTMGELRKFYSLADVVFVGRSLVPMGGSDPMEVAALGKPIVVGPHTDNFALPVSALREADAIRIADSAEAVVATVCALLHDPVVAEELGARARRVVIANQGATASTVAGLVDLLKGVSR